MKKVITILVLLIAFSGFSQQFKISNEAPKEQVVFKEIKNDTIAVEVLYGDEVKNASRIVKQVKCIFDYNEKLEGVIFRKVDHYLIDGKKINVEDILFERRKETDNGILIWGNGMTTVPGTITPLDYNIPEFNMPTK